MTKNTALKILNPVLVVLLINQILTGLFGLKLSPEAFEIFHRKAAIVLASLVVLHLILNFNWIKANYFKGRKVFQ
jgi:heme A synthase